MACCTLSVSRGGLRWWGITILGNVGMEREGKGPGGKGFQGLAVFCTPFLSGEGSRWWERRFQGVVGFSEK